MGRPTKLTPQVQQFIVEQIPSGAALVHICGAVGIDYSTYRKWMVRGEEELKRRENPRVKEGSIQWDEEQIFVEFFDDVTRAQNEAIVSAAASFKLGMFDQPHSQKIVETKTETRLRNVTDPETGKKIQEPYEHVTRTERTVEGVRPGDWRAAQAWLQVRDPENWSPKNVLEHKWDDNQFETSKESLLDKLAEMNRRFMGVEEDAEAEEDGSAS